MDLKKDVKGLLWTPLVFPNPKGGPGGLKCGLGFLFVILFPLLFLWGGEAQSGFIFDIGLGGDFYLVDKEASNGQGFINILLHDTSYESQFWLDLGAGGLVGETATSYLKAPQFYYSLGKVGESSITMGRVLLDWSYGDDFWNLGLVQPLFTWNEARPEAQGLTGIFLKVPLHRGGVELSFFASPLFLPGQGPSYQLTNGQFLSSNPWFSEPVNVVTLSGGERVELNFQIDLPKVQDVVQQISTGFLLGTPQHKKGFLFNGFYLSKPRNELSLPFSGSLNPITFKGDITVLPVVAYHRVMGIDMGWNAYGGKTLFSWIREADVIYTAPENSTFPTYTDQNIFSLTQLFRFKNHQRLWLAYINSQGGRVGTAGIFSGGDVSVNLDQRRFDEAARVAWEGFLFRGRGKKHRLKLSLSGTYGLIQDNLWISTDLAWGLAQGVWLFSQCDFFGGSEPFILAGDFISTYQNNDRCFLGGHYAF